MSDISVAILGLERIGASVGLALKRYNASRDARHTFKITGYDAIGAASDAVQRGIVDELARNAAGAARQRDIVVLALPYASVSPTLRAIAETLRPGAVVLDFAPLKGPSIGWAEQHLSQDTYLVGLTPVINPAYLFDGIDDIDHAHADLFDSGAMLLMPAANCSKNAVELATDFSTLLGSKPHFMDAGEHDALSAMTDGLPLLLGATYFYMLQNSRAWDDARRLTNPNFGRLTHHLVDSHPDDLRDLLLNNREQVTHHLDNLIDTLSAVRGVLRDNNRDALEAVLIDAVQAYQVWLGRRQRGKWDDDQPSNTASPSLMSGLMGDYLARKLRGEGDERK